MSALLLVPSPLRAARAARRLCDAEGGVLLGARVTTLDALAPSLLAAAGDRRPVLSQLAERLLALEAGDAAGEPLAGSPPEGGLSRALASALAELRRGEVSAAEVRAGAAALEGRAGHRLSRLAAALEAYDARLSSAGALDRRGALRAAAAALARGARCEPLQDLDLLVLDGFAALPPAAFELVSALAHRARRTLARVPFFPDRPDASAPAELLLRRVEGLHELAARREVSVALEDLDGGGRAARLARMLRAVAGGPGGGPSGADGTVLSAAGAGEEGEAELAARIAARLLEQGLQPEEIALFAPAPDRAAPRLTRAFAAMGVPLATGRGQAVVDLPPVRAVLDALHAAVGPGRAALEAVASSPYLGLARVPARLGFWLDRAGALDGRGCPEEALRSRAGALSSPAAARERAELLRSAEALGRVRDALRPLGATASARQHAATLRGFLAAAGVRRRAARAEQALARRDLAALTRLEEAADELADAAGLLGRGAEPIRAERWLSMLELALQGRAVPAEEPAAGAVELWPVSEAPGISARAALVIGCARGAFPAPPPAEPLLRDGERAAINRAARRAAVRSGPARRAEALHAAFCALAAGREILALTWAGPGPDGAASSLAPLAAEALAAAGVDMPSGPAPDPSLAESRSPAEALRAAARAAREGRAETALASLASLEVPAGAGEAASELAGRAASAIARGALERERREAILGRRASPAAGALPAPLAPELARALPAEWSPSQLEAHARCPYRIFAGLALGLAEPEAAELDIEPRDEGQLAHAILERFLRARLARGALPLSGAPEEREELAGVAAELFARFEADGRTGDRAVWPGRRAAVLSRLQRVIAAEAAAVDGVVPALLEHRFGGSAGAPPLAFSDPAGGPEVRMKGRLDRIDASPDRLVLVDYKDTKAEGAWKEKLDPREFGATSFQIPAYLMAAALALPGRARLEATFLLLRSAERLAPVAIEPDDPFLALDDAGRAAARAAGKPGFGDAVVAAVRRIRAGELPIASLDCTGCAFGAVCRAQELAEAVS